MAAPAAPVVVGLDLAAGGVVLMALVVGIGLLWLWDTTFGAVLESLANVLKFGGIRGHGGVDFGRPIRALNSAVRATLSDWIRLNEITLGKFWHANAKLYEYLGDSINYLSHQTLAGISTLTGGTLPRLVHDHTEPLTKTIGGVEKKTRAQGRTEARTRAHADRAAVAHTDNLFGKAQAGIDHIAKEKVPALTREVDSLEADVHSLQHSVGRVIPKRLSRLERLLGAGVIGGAAVYALTRVFPYWQCSNVKRFMRGICRADRGLLDALLGGLFLLALPLSLEEFAETLQGIVEPTAEAVYDVIAEARL